MKIRFVLLACLCVFGMGFHSAVAEQVTLHVFLQSHLDPVWLWNREQGIDAAIATARTMCDILDDYPETHMTRGEAWIYECCEKYDPKTFARLKAHVAGGRLHVVGSEYVQPDCNFPAGDAMADHLAFAGRYFRDHVGVKKIETGYNPDSFGHGAYLPRFLTAAGMKNYLFMRPGYWGNEKTLPGEIFRWRSPDGAEVLAARINGCYNPSSEDGSMYWQITNVIANCDKRIGHCFTMVGVGDHGGGPARAQIDWIEKHRREWPDVKIVYSHPDAFFDAVRQSGVELPVVADELQHHAIGCYTALSRIKREVRATEDALRRDGKLLRPEVLDACRGKLYFSTFHDILGGCSIASAYPDIYESLGFVRNLCREARIAETRSRNTMLPPAKCQRVIFDNPGAHRWRGVTEFEAWLKSHEGWYSWGDASLNKTVVLRDAAGRSVPIQVVPHRDKSGRPQPNFAIALDLAPGEMRTYFLSYDKTDDERIAERPLAPRKPPRYRFEVIEDETDTWSHGVKGYPKAARTMSRVGEGKSLSSGAVVNERVCEYADASGRAVVRERSEIGLDGQRLAIRLDWLQPREIVKLAIDPEFTVTGRVDRVPGGDVVRRLDGEEWPFAGAVTLLGAKGERLSIVCRDTAALDVQPDGTVRLTLLRTPPYSEHIPSKVSDASCPVTDLGSHTYDVRVIRHATPAQVDEALYSLSSPLVFSETTQGVGKAGLSSSAGANADIEHHPVATVPLSSCQVTIVNDAPAGESVAYNTNFVSSSVGLYPLGAKPLFRISATCGGKPAAGAVVTAVVESAGSWYQPKSVPVALDAKGEARFVVDAPSEPGWVQVTAKLGNAKAAAGAMCGRDAIRPALPPPADFKAFWAAEIAALLKSPMKATLKEVEPQKNLKGKIRTWEFEVTCRGPRPATGYVSMPVGAKPKSLPLYVGFNGAGDVSAYRSDHYGEVAIAIQVNKFGIPNGLGQPWDYRKTKWYESDIRDYSRRGMESPKTAFYKWMILRNLRAMQWGKSLPEWNGRDFLLNGESLGGGQSLIMGALDPDVKFVCACVPALCDHNAARLGRMNGYPQFWKPDAKGGLPEAARQLAETARYFDAVNFCTLYTPDKEVTIGTGYCDTLCPPDGVISAYLAIPKNVKKYLWLNPPAGHGAGNYHGGRRLFELLGKW